MANLYYGVLTQIFEITELKVLVLQTLADVGSNTTLTGNFQNVFTRDSARVALCPW